MLLTLRNDSYYICVLKTQANTQIIVYTEFFYTNGWHQVAPRGNTAEPKPICKNLSCPDEWGEEAAKPNEAGRRQRCNFPGQKSHRAGVPLLAWERGEEHPWPAPSFTLLLFLLIPPGIIGVTASHMVGYDPPDKVQQHRISYWCSTSHSISSGTSCLTCVRGIQPWQVLPTLLGTAAQKTKQNHERRSMWVFFCPEILWIVQVHYIVENWEKLYKDETLKQQVFMKEREIHRVWSSTEFFWVLFFLHDARN